MWDGRTYGRTPYGRFSQNQNFLEERLPYFHVAKYHLGKVNLERVGQRSSSTSVCDLRGGPQGIAGLLVCPFASVALHCSFAC